MKFLTVRELRGSAAAVWKTLPAEREMVVTNNGRPVAILCSVAEDQVEESLAAIRQARAVAAVARLQAEAAEKKDPQISPEEIDEEIRQSRRERHR